MERGISRRNFLVGSAFAAGGLTMLATRLFRASSFVPDLTLPPIADWTITRSGSNPCITIPAAESAEQYVPAPLRLADGTIWVYVKGNSRIYAWKSTDDGVTFTIQNGGTAVIVPGAGSAWDHTFALEPTVIYDEATGTIHLWYKGYPGVSSSGWSWGHATADDSDPTAFTKDAGNPILEAQDLAVEFSWASAHDLAISSVLKIGSDFHFYGYVEVNDVYYLCHTTGTTWNDPSVPAFELLTRWDSTPLFETPSIARMLDGTYLMLYSAGVSGLVGSRSCYAATSPDGLPPWTQMTGVVLDPTAGWESNQVYSGQLIRSNVAPYADPYTDGSGRWLYYYSGLSAAHIAQSGLAYIKVR